MSTSPKTPYGYETYLKMIKSVAPNDKPMTLREWKKVAEKDRNRPGAPTIPDKAMADLLKY